LEGLVGTYHCVWKTAVEDPEKRKRFREFVNAPEKTDPVQQWTTERDQRRPVLESESESETA
jgi:nitrite reductase (NADH) large subunit